MGNLRILATNLHDTAALTATSEAMPVEYTQRSERSYVWRSVDRQDQVIGASLGEMGFVDCVALARHNLGAAGLIQVELLLNDAVVKDSGVMAAAMFVPAGVWRAGIDPWGATYNERLPGGSSLGIWWLDAPVAADSYRITISSMDASPSGYFEIGRIFSGLSFSPSVNMNWGVGLEWVEPGTHVRTEGGSQRTIGGGGHSYRVFDLQLDWINELDLQRLVTELVKSGIAQDLLVSLYPGAGGLDELQHTMICRRQNNLSHTHNYYKNWTAALSFEEV